MIPDHRHLARGGAVAILLGDEFSHFVAFFLHNILNPLVCTNGSL